MPKFTLIAEHIDYTGVRSQKNTMEFDEEYLGDILNNVKQFLQGTGFIIDGTIDIVDSLKEEALPRKETVDQLKRIRNVTKGIDIGDRVSKMYKHGLNNVIKIVSAYPVI